MGGSSSSTIAHLEGTQSMKLPVRQFTSFTWQLLWCTLQCPPVSWSSVLHTTVALLAALQYTRYSSKLLVGFQLNTNRSEPRSQTSSLSSSWAVRMYWQSAARMWYLLSSANIFWSKQPSWLNLRSGRSTSSHLLRQQWQLQLLPSRGKSIHSGWPNSLPMKLRQALLPRLKVISRIILCRAIPLKVFWVQPEFTLMCSQISASNSHIERVLSPTRAWSWLQAQEMQGSPCRLLVSLQAISPTFQSSSFTSFSSLIHMSGVAMAIRNPNPMPPSDEGRQRPGKPETSSAMRMTLGSIFLARSLAMERQARASMLRLSLKYSWQLPVKLTEAPWWWQSMEVTPSKRQPSQRYSSSQKRMLESRKRSTSYLEQSKTRLSQRGWLPFSPPWKYWQSVPSHMLIPSSTFLAACECTRSMITLIPMPWAASTSYLNWLGVPKREETLKKLEQ